MTTSQQIKKNLATVFPGIKFSVRQTISSMSESIYVTWNAAQAGAPDRDFVWDAISHHACDMRYIHLKAK